MLDAWVMALCWFGIVQQGVPADPKPEALEGAWASFCNALPERQAEIVGAITARIEASGDATLAPLMALRDRAARELDTKPAAAREFYDPTTYAPRGGAARRAPVDPASVEAAEKRGLFKPWDNELPFAARVSWSFSRDVAFESGEPLDPVRQLENYLNGYPPRADVLVAWLEKKFDFDPAMNLAADHFDHLYCDLNGHAYPEITLYDAWSSGNGMDMPDVEVIAFARRLQKDESWHSPIAPDARRAKLYDQISDAFLVWFRYRVWIEAAASLFVRPEAALRESHEGLRRRLHALYASEEGSVDRIAKSLAEAKTRDAFVASIDGKLRAEPELDAKAARWCRERQSQQWVIARCAYAVLRERGMLSE
jgi:hypothetical protein